MLYQELLMGELPYFVSVSKMGSFQEHRHAEIEINYCLEGSCQLIVDKCLYTLKKGEFIFVNSMMSHGVPESAFNDCTTLTIEVGPILLGGYFEALAGRFPQKTVFDSNDNPELVSLFEEMAELTTKPKEFSELTVRGDIFKLCATIMEEMVMENEETHTAKALKSVANIEKALELIHTNYMEQLSVEEVSTYCGYSKSNFCKIFKNITGRTFHAMLNEQRVRIACNLLKETDQPVEKIATQIGFLDAKSFCRVFKNCVGVTPGQVRKRTGKC